MKPKEPKANHCINVTQEVWEFWTEQAKKRQISRTELLRQAVKRYSEYPGARGSEIIVPAATDDSLERAGAGEVYPLKPKLDAIKTPMDQPLRPFPKSTQLRKK